MQPREICLQAHCGLTMDEDQRARIMKKKECPPQAVSPMT